ncbi:MAG: VCBS repeat-containing protein, partial [Bacteroidota bacterium]
MIRLLSGFALLCTLLLACGESSDAPMAAPETKDAALVLPSFTDVTQAAGLDFDHVSGASGAFYMPEIMSGGAAFLDFNQDGAPDILFAGGGDWERSGTVPSLRLLVNNGDGTFRDASTTAGVASVEAYVFGFTVGDYDRDGDEDVF